MESATSELTRDSASYEEKRTGYFSWALVATALVVVLPSATVTAFVRLGHTDVNPFLTWAVTAALSASLLALGTGWWIRQPGSTTMSFGELMLWRWVRRRHADEQVAEGARVLGSQETTPSIGIETTRRGQLEMLRALNGALEVRDPYTRGHARRVERHAYRTGLAMHLTVDDIFNLRLAASLHDIGKIRVPIEIIRKQGPLDTDEWATMKTHSAIGAEIIANIGNPKLVSAVRYHHERWDGSGYPDGLKGEEIPLHARIIGVCDSFDAITSNRPYRSKSNRKKAIAIIQEQSGKQFDPQVVDAFLSALPRGLTGLAALSWLSFPAFERAVAQIGGFVRNAGAMGVAGAIAASGVTGVVATNVHPSKYLSGPATHAADSGSKQQLKNQPSKNKVSGDPEAVAPVILNPAAGTKKASGTSRKHQDSNVKGARVTSRSGAANKAPGRGVMTLGAEPADEERTPPGQEKKEEAAEAGVDETGDDAQVDHGRSGSGKKSNESNESDDSDDSDDVEERVEDTVDQTDKKTPPGRSKTPKSPTGSSGDDTIEQADTSESDDETKGNGKSK